MIGMIKLSVGLMLKVNNSRRLGAKGSYLTLVRVADRILLLRGDELYFGSHQKYFCVLKSDNKDIIKVERVQRQASKFILNDSVSAYR